MKKYVIGFIVGVIVATASSAYADEGLQKVEAYLRPSLPITLDGKPVTLGSSPVMYDGSTYLKLRDISALTGLQVNWNDATQTVELNNGTVNKAVYQSASTTTTASIADQITEVQKKIDDTKGSMTINDVMIQSIQHWLDTTPQASDKDRQSEMDRMSQYQQRKADNEQQLSDLQAQLSTLQAQQ